MNDHAIPFQLEAAVLYGLLLAFAATLWVLSI